MFKIRSLLYCCFKSADETPSEADPCHADGHEIVKPGQAPRLVISVLDADKEDVCSPTYFEVGPAGMGRTPMSPPTVAGSMICGTSTGTSVDGKTDFKSSECLSPPHQNFVIRYDEETTKYTIQDVGVGSGTFVKIEEAHPVSTTGNTIISFGDTHMMVRLVDQSTVKVKFVDGPKAMEDFVFSRFEKPVVMIGRMADCQIVFEASSLSRYQTTIYWDNTAMCWMIVDGNMARASTNGTWLFVDEEYALSSGTIFKAGESVYSIDVQIS